MTDLDARPAIPEIQYDPISDLECCSEHGDQDIGYVFDGTTHTHAVCCVDGCVARAALKEVER